MNDALFEKRKAAALRLRECTRDKGYTKVSSAKRADVSRQVLDELLDQKFLKDNDIEYDLYEREVDGRKAIYCHFDNEEDRNRNNRRRSVPTAH